ncbi:NUDIX domain-containing protein [Nonomuraea deserti]|uniref:NUDIX domain-containing protein n=1 Tax=Nonomuraea deserti TaxID=1848322 RepID=UPI002686B41C
MPIAAAAREVEEETGWRPGPLRPLLSVQPLNGSDSMHHVYRAESATRVGPPADPSQSTRAEWLHLSLVRGLIAGGEMVCGTSVAALLYLLVEHIPHGGAARPPADPGRCLLLPDLPDLF